MNIGAKLDSAERTEGTTVELCDDTQAIRQNVSRPIVFLGPSIPRDVACATLPTADFRPPVKRGDLDCIPSGSVIGIIDGVFAQNLAISPSEVRDAIARGVTIYGAASMGALRAADTPQVVGVGRIYEMYRSGVIERDDEVALLFHPGTKAAITEPLINLRYAVERLVRAGSLNPDTGKALVGCYASMHYRERTYKTLLGRPEFSQLRDVDTLLVLLKRFDLKRDDAQFLLETLAHLPPGVSEPTDARDEGAPVGSVFARVQANEDSAADVLIWESGDTISFAELLLFLHLSGTFEEQARIAIGRHAISGARLRGPSDSARAETGDFANPQDLLDATRLIWGWESPEEAHVSLHDLGIGIRDLSVTLEAEAEVSRQLRCHAQRCSKSFAKALRGQLWLDDLSLKREAMRLGAVRYFSELAKTAGIAVDEGALQDARRTICRLRGAMQWRMVKSDLATFGVDEGALDAAVQRLAEARSAAAPVVRHLDHRRRIEEAPENGNTMWGVSGLEFGISPKAAGSRRFSMDLGESVKVADEIARAIGIVRIGQIGQLDTLGIHVAQAFGMRSGWSTSFSSGKSETPEGARVGSIMEEVEIFAQDAFRPSLAARTSFQEGSQDLPLIDPVSLGLPFDSRYREDQTLEWASCVDVLNGEKMLVPTASVMGERSANDIYYSPRLGGKIFSSSGLASGFSLSEAAVHATAEVIERHAVRLAEIEIDNPGRVGVRRFYFLDLETLPEIPQRIVSKYEAAGMVVRILDVTSEINVPTFYARVFNDPFTGSGSMSSDGFACHPDPEVALTMALLEAAQTKAGVISGGREDYSLQARSLGRHERPRTMLPEAQAFWFCNDRPSRTFDPAQGYSSDDISSELEWMLKRIRDAGYARVLLADCTNERIRPAYAVRVLLPESEVTNPLHTGARARATLIRDLLPRFVPETEPE